MVVVYSQLQGGCQIAPNIGMYYLRCNRGTRLQCELVGESSCMVLHDLASVRQARIIRVPPVESRFITPQGGEKRTLFPLVEHGDSSPAVHII